MGHKRFKNTVCFISIYPLKILELKAFRKVALKKVSLKPRASATVKVLLHTIQFVCFL